MIPARVKKFLDSSGVKYELLEHRTVFTAHDKAATLHTPEKMVGKTLVIKLDKELALITLSANKNLDKKKFIKAAKATVATKVARLEFATERLIKNKLKGVKIGAVPPFGSLWGTMTFIDRRLMKNPKIIINSGDNNWSVKITPAQYKKLVPKLVMGDFSKNR